MSFKINNRVIADLSCNHNQDINIALKLIEEAHKAGADAIKLQTYTPWKWTNELKEYTNSLGMDLFLQPSLINCPSEKFQKPISVKKIRKYEDIIEMELLEAQAEANAFQQLVIRNNQ